MCDDRNIHVRQTVKPFPDQLPHPSLYNDPALLKLAFYSSLLLYSVHEQILGAAEPQER